MAEVARAYVTIIPSMQGAQETITNELTGASTPAGKAAGKKAGSAMGKSMGDTLSSLGGKLTKSVTAPLTAIGAAAIAGWTSVDEGLDTIVTKTGASGDALSEMEQIMRNITTDIPVGFADAGSAIGEVNTRFGVTGQELQDLSKQFLQFAEINGVDVSNAVDSTSKVLAAFGMDAADAGLMLDALNVVGQQTGVGVDTLSQQLALNAASFAELGMSAYDAASFLGQVDMAGLDASTMMMGLKTAMKTAASEGKGLNESMQDFTKVMKGNGTQAEKLQAAYELFGTKAGAAIFNAVQNGTLDLENLTGSLTEFEGSVASTFEGTLDPIDQMKTALNSLTLIGADLVNAAAPIINDVFAVVTPMIQKLSEAFQNLSPEMQANIVKFGLAAAAAGPLLSMVGKLSGGIGGIVGKLGGLGGGLGKVAGAAGPAATATGSLGSGLAAAVPGILAFSLGALAVAAAIRIIGPYLTDLGTAIGTIVEAVGEAASEIITAFAPVAETIGSVVTEVVGIVGETLVTGMQTASDSITQIVSTIGEAITGIVDSVSGTVESMSGLVESIGGTVSQIGSAISEVVSTVASGISEVVGPLGDSISGVLDTALAGISTGIETIVTAVGESISGITESFGGFVESVGTAGESIGTAFATINDSIGGVIESIGGAISGITDSIGGAISGVLDSIAGIFTSIGTGAKDAGDGFSVLADAVIRIVNDTKITDLAATLNRVGDGIKSITKNARNAPAVTALFDSISSAMGQLSTIGTTATDSLSSLDLSSGFQTALSDAVTVVTEGIAQLQSIFASTTFSFNTHIALPHFTMSGKFDAESGSVPTVNVSWFAKGAILTAPTIFGMMNGNLLGGGEAGPEAIAPISELQKYLNAAPVTNVYIDGIKYNTDEYVDSTINNFVETMVRKNKMYAG